MVDRVYLGKDGTDYVLRVSKPGVDVKTAGAEDLLFDSESAHFGQIIDAGTVDIDAGTSSSVSHTFPSGMVPVVVYDIGTRTDVTGSTTTWDAIDNFLVDYYVNVTVESTNSSTTFTNNSASQDASVNYTIFTIDENTL